MASYKEEVDVPEGINVTLEKGVFTVKGEKGEVSRKLFYPGINISAGAGKVVFDIPKWNQRFKKIVFTYKAHLLNMFKGVSEGITYKLKVCSSHFPMTVSYKDNVLEVKNFIGEREPRSMKVKEGVEVKVDGEIISLEGVDKELVGQTASRIESLTNRKGFDKRVFQDGIYMIQKDGRDL